MDENSSEARGVSLSMPMTTLSSSPGLPSMTKAQIESFKGKDEDLNRIECYLETDDLWKRFHELGTEMIITKSGRYVFNKGKKCFFCCCCNFKLFFFLLF